MASKTTKQQEMSAEMRKTVNGVHEALSEWRDEVEAATERYSGKVTDKLTAAAEAFGWPESSVKLAAQQLKEVSKAQLDFLDQMMDSWQNEMRSPGPFMSPQAFMPASWSSSAGFGGLPMTPVHLWVQAADMWQKNWVNAMEMWTGGRSSSH